MSSKKIHCRECGQLKFNSGRGLCKSCRSRLETEGILDTKYPSSVIEGEIHIPRRRYRRRKPSKIALLGGHWENHKGIQVWIPDNRSISKNSE